ncbi:hypothetical protein I8F93_04985 [Enterococcus gallinarum]|nr:hypothetical protein [Enterococcus gallinarum]
MGKKISKFFLKTKVKKKKAGNKKEACILLLKKARALERRIILCTPEKLEIGRWCCYKGFMKNLR